MLVTRPVEVRHVLGTQRNTVPKVLCLKRLKQSQGSPAGPTTFAKPSQGAATYLYSDAYSFGRAPAVTSPSPVILGHSC